MLSTAKKTLDRIKSHQYIKIYAEELTYFKIVPDKTIDNNTILIARAAHELYSSPKDRIKTNAKHLNMEYKIKDRLFFDVVFSPGDAHFYLSCPKSWDKFMYLKMQTIWPKCAISKVTAPELNDFDESISSCCDIRLRKNNFFAFNATPKSLDPLNSMFTVLKDLDQENNEKVRISYVFDPINRLDWYQKANEIYGDYKKGKMPKRQGVTRDDVVQNGFNLLMYGVDMYIQMKLLVIEGMLGFMGAGETREDRIEKLIQAQGDERAKDLEVLKQMAKGGLSQFTYRKLNGCTFNSFIRIVSQGTNSNKRITNMRTVANSFKDLNGDNEFETVELPRKKELERMKQIKEFDISDFWEDDVLGEEEVAKLLQLPQITLLSEYKIDSIDTRELNVPQELQQGSIKIGTAPLKGKLINAYWPTGKNVEPLPKIVMGPMGAGKTEDTANFCVSAHKKGDAVVVFDFIKENELSNTIEKFTDHVSINLADQANLFAMAYPEIEPGDTAWSRLETANILARQTEFLINSTIQGEPLSERMGRYLDAAAKTVFIHKGGTIGDVIRVLKNHMARQATINMALKSGIFKPDDDEIVDLVSLHEIDGKTGDIVGTRETLVSGIIDRISVLNKDIYIRQMLKSEVNYKQNFLNWIDQGKTILIKLPESKFTNKQVKDTIVTYFMGRIWLAALRRSGGRITHLVTDEIHQVPTAARLVSGVVTEGRKFGIDFYFTIHYLKQFKDLHDAIKSSGCSYKLLAGIEKENLKALEQEIAPFTVDEGLTMKPFHSLNIINYGNQYSKFISELPKPL